jgi:hypothetical protein
VNKHIKQPEKENTEGQGGFHVMTYEIIINSGDGKSYSSEWKTSYDSVEGVVLLKLKMYVAQVVDIFKHTIH